MRTLLGAGTPREAASARFAFPFLVQAADTIAFVILAASAVSESDAARAALIVATSCQAV